MRSSSVLTVAADSLAGARDSPFLEIFKQKGFEVILMTEAIDEYCVGQLKEVRRRHVDGADRPV